MEFSPSRFICCGLQQSPCSPRLWQGLSSVPYHRFVCKAALAASPERPALFASPLRPSQSSPNRHLSITGEVHLISLTTTMWKVAMGKLTQKCLLSRSLSESILTHGSEPLIPGCHLMLTSPHRHWSGSLALSTCEQIHWEPKNPQNHIEQARLVVLSVLQIEGKTFLSPAKRLRLVSLWWSGAKPAVSLR